MEPGSALLVARELLCLIPIGRGHRVGVLFGECTLSLKGLVFRGWQCMTLDFLRCRWYNTSIPTKLFSISYILTAPGFQTTETRHPLRIVGNP